MQILDMEFSSWFQNKQILLDFSSDWFEIFYLNIALLSVMDWWLTVIEIEGITLRNSWFHLIQWK